MVPERELLPARRYCEQFDIRHGNIVYTIGVGFYGDGRPGELFVDAGKAGTDLRTTSHDLAVATSRLLQLGISVEDLRHTFARDDTGAPQGIIGVVLDRIALGQIASKEAAE